MFRPRNTGPFLFSFFFVFFLSFIFNEPPRETRWAAGEGRRGILLALSGDMLQCSGVHRSGPWLRRPQLPNFFGLIVPLSSMQPVSNFAGDPWGQILRAPVVQTGGLLLV
jgi:hypothetical protein